MLTETETEKEGFLIGVAMCVASCCFVTRILMNQSLTSGGNLIQSWMEASLIRGRLEGSWNWGNRGAFSRSYVQLLRNNQEGFSTVGSTWENRVGSWNTGSQTRVSSDSEEFWTPGN
jgi:predicted small secreted protein